MLYLKWVTLSSPLFEPHMTLLIGEIPEICHLKNIINPENTGIHTYQLEQDFSQQPHPPGRSKPKEIAGKKLPVPFVEIEMFQQNKSSKGSKTYNLPLKPDYMCLLSTYKICT